MDSEQPSTKVVKNSPIPTAGKRYGGRVKGTPNKSTLSLREKAERLGVDPFEVLLLFAKGDWKGLGYPMQTHVVAYTKDGEPIEEDVIKPTERLKAASEATQYLEAKRKAIEHSGPNGGPIETAEVSKMPREQIEARIKALLEKRGSP